MARTIKATAITFGGYLYQNLVGIELLCNWLDDPSLYEWVKLESDDEAPQQKGLDDIVARCPDGTIVLLQVKFTVDQHDPANALSWDWLLKHKPRGRSLIQKWADAFFSVGATNVAEVALLTNRIPDNDFQSCLDEASRRVDLSKVPAGIYSQLQEQLTSIERINEFFCEFEFRHSQQSDLALERTLLDRYVPRHTDRHGWLVLYREVIDWAVRINFPLPNGRINLELLRGVLNTNRPKPLQQSFHVPIGYCPPDEGFDKDFVKHLTSQDKRVVVLWGSPGQGKSTYLSHVCASLEKQGTPFIRHHYFLDLSDSSDRFTFAQVANSLMAQMEAHHVEYVQGLKDDATLLRTWVEACAAGYAEQGKKFLIVIDGLDHVWRELDRNKRPLDSLFKYLLPVPDNVTLVIGTQKVAPEQLPDLFSKYVTSEDWVELPRMSLAAIKNWLQLQLTAQRFELSQSSHQDREQLAEISKAFERLTGGHPLVLTYSFASLARENRTLSSNMVDDFPIRPEGDIKVYYAALWLRLSAAAKDALHLIADSGFIWPTLGLETCLNVQVGELARETGHLFHITEAGQVPFHGSLLVVIRAEPTHPGRIQRLLPAVVNWLESKAPDFHRWGWLWLYKAKTGSPEDLLNLPCRQWVIDSLAKAYPLEPIIEILSVAERTAFESGQYPRAVRLRWLKIRLMNGTDFQLDDYDRLYRCALKLSDDDFPLRILSADFNNASVNQLHLLGMQYLAAGRIADAAECQENVRRRINDRLKANAYDSHSLSAALKKHLELTAATGEYSPARIVRSLLAFKLPDLFRFFLSELSKRQDLRLLMDFVECPMTRSMRMHLELAAIRLAGECQAQIHNWPEFKRFKCHPISACWALLYARDQYKPIAFATYDPSLDAKSHGDPEKAETERYLHVLFYFYLSQCLELGGAPFVDTSQKYSNRIWLNEANEHILTIANAIGAVLARGDIPVFSLPFRLLKGISTPEKYEALVDYIPFRRTILSVAHEVFILTSIRSANTVIPATEWRRVVDSKHFVFSEWLERYVAEGGQLVELCAVEVELKNALQKTAETVSPFNERTEKYLELCELAIHMNLDDFASDALNRALNCVIGYGWRKDGTLAHVLDAISAISVVDKEYACDLIVKVCPIVSRIGDMTEKDGVRESDLAELLLRLMPKSYVSYYDHWLRSSEWYTAENVFAELVSIEPLVQPLMSFVTCAVWDSRAIQRLKQLAAAGDVAAISIIEGNARRFGNSIDEHGKEKFGNSTRKDEEVQNHGIDLSLYPPSDASLSRLIEEIGALKIYVAERSVVRDWFDYWRSQKKGPELLKSIEAILESENVPWGVSDLLDDVFLLSRELEGPRRAYRWLVSAQIHRHGWDSYYASADVAVSRFETLAKYYPDHWQQFIADTCSSPLKTASERLIIPHHLLVKFLLTVGQHAVAKIVTEEMVFSVIEDFSDQPLEPPSWLVAE